MKLFPMIPKVMEFVINLIIVVIIMSKVVGWIGKHSRIDASVNPGIPHAEKGIIMTQCIIKTDFNLLPGS